MESQMKMKHAVEKEYLVYQEDQHKASSTLDEEKCHLQGIQSDIKNI